MIEQASPAAPVSRGRGSAMHPSADADAWSGVRIAAEPSRAVCCAACGCALYPDPSPAGEQVWYHFAPARGRDANGCRIACASISHRPDGRPLDRNWV